MQCDRKNEDRLGGISNHDREGRYGGFVITRDKEWKQKC